MGSKLTYALVGIFVIGLATATVAASLWLSLGDFQRDYKTYRVYTKESVSGLYVDAPVRYRGVDVGRVREITLDPDNIERVRLQLDIKEHTPIKEDTVAVLAMQGLTGIAFVDLRGGTQSAPPLEADPGQAYPVIESGPSLMTRLDEGINTLLTSVQSVSDDLNELMNEDNRRGLARVIDNLEAVSATLADNRSTLAEGMDNANRMLEQGAQASERLPELMERLNRSTRTVEEMADEIAHTAKSVRQTTDRMRETVEDNRDDVARFTAKTLPEIDALVQELRSVTGSLRRVTRQIEDDPSVVVRGRDAPPPGPGEKQE